MIQSADKKRKEKLHICIFRAVWIVFAIIGMLYTVRMGLRYGKSIADSRSYDIYEYISLDDTRISVSGLPYKYRGRGYRLQPDGNYSEGVDKYAECTAGGRIRFRTNSPSVHIQGKYGDIMELPWFSDYGANGIDIYAGGRWRLTLSASDKRFKSFSGILKIDNMHQEMTEGRDALPAGGVCLFLI